MKMKVRIDNWIGMFLLCFPAFNDYAIQKVPVLHDAITIWGACSFSYLLYVVIKHRIRISKGNKWIIVFAVIYCFATLINMSEELFSAVSQSIRMLLIPFYLVVAYYRGPNHFRRSTHKLSCLISVLLLIDSLVVFYQVFFYSGYTGASYSYFGLDNYAAFFVIPLIGIVFYDAYVLNITTKKKAWAIFGVCFCAKIATHCTTAVVAMTMIVLLSLFLKYLPILRRYLSIKGLIVIIIIFVFGSALFDIQKHFDSVFQLLGKDSTMNYRSVIWPKAINAIIKRPVLGYGKVSAEVFKINAGLSVVYDTSASHPHNYILCILFYTGLIGLVCYALIFSDIISSLRKIIKNNKSTMIFLPILVGFLIIGIADGYIMIPAFYSLISIISLEYSRTIKPTSKKKAT